MSEEYPTIKRSDLSEGEMKLVRAGPTDVLLIKIGGIIHAVEPLCPHYKQPLVDGLVCGGQLRCGWHQSVFDVASGDVVEPPALIGLKKFPVRIDADFVLVDVASYRADRRRFVILGGGAAGFSAAKTLRGNGFEGSLTIISSDNEPPYDRPNLSKDFLAGKPLDTPLPLAEPAFYESNQIELRLGVSAEMVDRVARTVVLSDGTAVPFDKLLIATGATPRRLDVPGSDCAGVHVLRSLHDAGQLIEAITRARSVVIVGGNFIAMEAAAALRQRGLSVTVVMRNALPMSSTFGDEIALMIKHVHENAGIEFRAGREVIRFEGTDRLSAVILDDGSRLQCDCCLLAIGVQPNTAFMHSAFAELIDDDGGLRVDQHFMLCENIYAAGDIAHGKLGCAAWSKRIEHWRVAEQMGKIAALNMLGKAQTFDEVPYFWTYQFDLGLDYIGHANRWDELVIHGDVKKQDFVACYVQQDEIVAVCAAGRSKQACAITELMRRHRMPTPHEIREADFDYVERLRKISLP